MAMGTEIGRVEWGGDPSHRSRQAHTSLHRMVGEHKVAQRKLLAPPRRSRAHPRHGEGHLCTCGLGEATRGSPGIWYAGSSRQRVSTELQKEKQEGWNFQKLKLIITMMMITTANIGTVLSPFHTVTQLIFLTDTKTTPYLQMRQMRPAQSYTYMRNKDFKVLHCVYDS